MAALAELHAASGLLAHLMIDDPRLLLVNAIAWLDPSSLLNSRPNPRYSEFDYDAEDELTVGLYVTRACFPAVYAGAVQLQWQRTDEHRIGRYIVDEISRNLVCSIHSLDELRYGPPVEFHGIDLTAPEADAVNPRLLPVFALFGLSVDGDNANDVQHTAFLTAKVLVESLMSRTEPIYQDMSNLLLWMFAMSGNTALDYTMEAFWENGYDTASWTPDDIALINAINLEARELIASADNALMLLNQDTELRTAFVRNVKNVLKAVRGSLSKGDSTHAHREPDSAAFVRYARWPDRS